MLTPQEIARNSIKRAGYSLKDPSSIQHPDPVTWIERYFYIPETNKAIVLEEYQRAVISEALRRDVSGNFVYSFILWSDLKKSAKSTIAAAVCLYLAWHTPWESIRVVANDLKQANSRTFFYIERAIRLNPILNAVCKRIKYHIELPNHTTIDAIPVDPKGEAGGGDLVTCFTELWAMKNEASKQLWTETTLSPLKFGKSLRWAESYAGREGESPILETAYDSGVKEGRQIDLGIPGLEVYVNEAARMLTLWNTQPRCVWQTPEYYAQESAVLTEEEFNRVHGNQWGSSTQKFVPIAWWDNCRNPNISPLRPGQGLGLALDAAVKVDSFGIVGLSNDVNQYGQIVPTVRYVRKWDPPQGGKIRFSNPLDPYDRETPEGELRWLCANNRVEFIAYDPRDLEEFVSRLEDVAFFEEFLQNTPRLIADKQLYDAIREGHIQHNGESDLRDHINNADASPEEDKLRIIKGRGHIDLAVALSMCYARTKYYNF
jgi:hypothetical protein